MEGGGCHFFELPQKKFCHTRDVYHFYGSLTNKVQYFYEVHTVKA